MSHCLARYYLCWICSFTGTDRQASESNGRVVVDGNTNNPVGCIRSTNLYTHFNSDIHPDPRSDCDSHPNAHPDPNAQPDRNADTKPTSNRCADADSDIDSDANPDTDTQTRCRLHWEYGRQGCFHPRKPGWPVLYRLA